MEIETPPLATHKNSREIPQGIDTCEKFERVTGKTVCFSFFMWMEQLVPVYMTLQLQQLRGHPQRWWNREGVAGCCTISMQTGQAGQTLEAKA